jgi:hypothetical protein
VAAFKNRFRLMGWERQKLNQAMAEAAIETDLSTEEE